MEKALVTVGEYISLKQLPIIEERLQDVKEEWELIAQDAESLVPSDDNAKEIKSMRAGVRKKYAEVEDAYKKIKAVYMAPWNALDDTFKQCIKEPYARADASLKSKAEEIDEGRKELMRTELFKYYEEYRTSLGLDAKIADARRSGIKVNLSDSMKSLKTQARAFLDRIDSDLKMIDTLEDRDEILVEYRQSLNVTEAVRVVNERHRQAEEIRMQREAEDESRKQREAHEAEIDAEIERVEAQNVAQIAEEQEDEFVSTPIVEKAPEVSETDVEKVYVTAFRVAGTLNMLKELKAFLENGGYEYQSIKEE